LKLSHEANRYSPRRLALRLPPIVLPDPFNRRPASFRENSLEIRVTPIRYDEAISWNHPDKMVELLLDSRKIGKDVGVIELEIVQDRSSRPKMHELGALVKESGIVFIRFDHKE
jgi:hypothetical protein